ncbi:hypothetical protein WUBG_04052 [Wuchereria bancrofti]|uniref:Uncharacterized protein n=1 Tax=Wuchereria bancrofti TaxID=6293 RepID=J9ESA4_WUCBA|nr:hypothetical protein WUBG_04052 [Wuchereria bancrofti]
MKIFKNLEISYGPGVVQKLCARFLQLSKESNTVPHLRSSCFKRRKASAENNFTVISEIRRCTSSKLTNKILNLNAETDEMNNHCDGQKYKMDFVPAEMKVNKIRFRRDCNVPIVNARKVESVEMQGQIQKAQNDGNIVRMVVKLAPSDDNPTITELPTIPTVSCLPNFQEKINDQMKKSSEKESDESNTDRSFQFENIEATSIISNNTSGNL